MNNDGQLTDAAHDIEDVELDNAADGNGLYEHFRFVADKGQALLRVDKFLVARLEKSSRNRVQQAAEAGCILVNGKAELPCQTPRCCSGSHGPPPL